jgi:hypothetical protein
MTKYDVINQYNLNLEADRFTPEKVGLVFKRSVGLASLRAHKNTVRR